MGLWMGRATTREKTNYLRVRVVGAQCLILASLAATCVWRVWRQNRTPKIIGRNIIWVVGGRVTRTTADVGSRTRYEEGGSESKKDVFQNYWRKHFPSVIYFEFGEPFCICGPLMHDRRVSRFSSTTPLNWGVRDGDNVNTYACFRKKTKPTNQNTKPLKAWTCTP